MEKSNPNVRLLQSSADGVAKFKAASGVNAAISDAEAKDNSPKEGVSITIRRRQLHSNRRMGRSFKLTKCFEDFPGSKEDLAVETSEIPGRRRRMAQFRVI